MNYRHGAFAFTHRPLRNAIGGLFIIYALGFVVFIATSVHMGTAQVSQARPLVTVLTGGPGRLEFAAKLIDEGWADTMFISGVNQDTGHSDLIDQYNLPHAWSDCCIVLGYEASNTWENICEIRHYTASRYNTLDSYPYIVSSYYHLPRVAVTITALWPDAQPILLAATRPSWTMVPHPKALRTLGVEYNKTLLSIAQLAIPFWSIQNCDNQTL